MNRANRTGNMAEMAVSTMLENIGYQKTPKKEFQKMIQADALPLSARETDIRKGIYGRKHHYDQPLYTREAYIGETIYGGRRRCDFLVYHPHLYPNCLVIEVKWQAASGSVDEKYPYLVLNIQKSGLDTVIVLDGGGYSAGAEKWLKAQVRNNQTGNNHLLAVLDAGGFQRWAKDNL